MAISKIDVIRAVNALNKEGTKPSSSNVLEYLGEGSLTTITKFIKEYTTEMEEELEMEARKQKFRPKPIFEDMTKMFMDMEKRIRELEAQVKELQKEKD